jgi:hypothetical protein
MFRSFFSILVSTVFVATAAGGPAEIAVLAAMNLSERPNYSWITTVQDDATTYSVKGKTNADGYVRVTLPMIEAVSERLGPDADSELEAIFKGRTRCVLHVQNDWKTVKELPSPVRDRDEIVWLDTMVFDKDPSDDAEEADQAAIPPMVVITSTRDDAKPRPFSNARLAVSPPHEELQLIASEPTNVTADGNIVSGTLSDVVARLLLAPDDDAGPQPLAAGGTFKLWLQGQQVVRYQLHLEGLMQVKKKKILMHQDSDTQLSDVGRTSFELPEQAWRKLSPPPPAVARAGASRRSPPAAPPKGSAR